MPRCAHQKAFIQIRSPNYHLQGYKVETIRIIATGLASVSLLLGLISCDSVASFENSYGTLAIAIASLISTLAALGIAVCGQRSADQRQDEHHQHLLDLEVRRQAPKIFVRPIRYHAGGVRSVRCQIENHGMTAAEVVKVTVTGGDDKTILQEWDSPITIMPKEWYPGPSLELSRLEQDGIEEITCTIECRHALVEGRIEAFETTFFAEGRTSQPIPVGDRGADSRNRRDDLEREALKYIKARATTDDD